MERQSKGSRGLEAYCKGGQGPPRAVAPPKKKKKNYTCLIFIANIFFIKVVLVVSKYVNPLSPELNPICYLLALLGAHHFLHVSRIRVRLISLFVQLRYTHIQCSVVLFKIPLYVSGWLAHHQEVQIYAVHAATSLLLWYVSVVAVGNGLNVRAGMYRV